MELQVVIRDVGARRREGVGYRGTDRQQAWAPGGPAQNLAPEAPAARGTVDGLGTAHPHHRSHHEMILEILPHAAQCVPQRDAQTVEQRRIAHTRKLKQFGGIGSACAHDHVVETLGVPGDRVPHGGTSLFFLFK